jgi:tetratricopeptide (TPR) repeat protein
MTFRAVAAALALTCLFAWPVAAQATPPASAAASGNAGAAHNESMSEVEIARGHFRLGIDSYRDGDLDTALIEFKRAYAAAPNFRLLYNLGQVSQELRDYPAAERYFSSYLQEGAAQIEAARKQEVEYELAKVRVRIASVAVTCNLREVEVFIDDVSVGKTPLTAAVRVSTGQRRVTGRIPGYAPITQVIDAAGGETVEVLLDFMSPRAAATAESEPVRLQNPRTHVNPLALTLVIGTGALAIGTGVVAALAESKASDYRDALKRKTSTPELKSLADDAKTRAAISDVLLGATVLAAAASVVVIWRDGMTERDDSTALRIGPGAVELTRRF